MRVLGVVVLFVAVVALLLVFLNWYVAPTKPSEKKDLVLALGQILAGTALLSGLYFTWRTLQVNREGQITERFTRAIDQLGSKELEIRLGGIYALERITRESEEDHWSIMEVLTAYVRQNSPWRPEETQQVEEDTAVEKKFEEFSKWKSEAEERIEEFSKWKSEAEERKSPVLAADIQAIMTVIGRRTRSFGHGEPERLDLRKTNLSGANLRKANLSGADLSEDNLTEANLLNADLRGADLSGADLSGANLWKADLTEANFTEAKLWGADLSEANLREANLWGANLSEAKLWAADLTEADLREANLWGADLSTEADLREANLWGADLSEANLSGAEHLTQEQLRWTIGDENIQLPPDLRPPAHWGVRTDEQIEGD